MQLKLSFEKKQSFIFMPWSPGVGRALLWHTGKVLLKPDGTPRLPYPRDPFTVNFVVVDNQYLDRGDSRQAVENWAGTGTGIFFQEGNFLYLRLRAEHEEGAAASSYPWLFSRMSFSMSHGITDGDFFVSGGTAYKTGVISGYRIKASADDGSYSQIKFTNLSFDVIYAKIKSLGDSLIGSTLMVGLHDPEKGTGETVEKQFIENFTRNLDVVKINCKDPRASLKQSVVDQQPFPNYWTTPSKEPGNLNNHVDKDTLKKYLPDAVGYCHGVLGVCVNGDGGLADPYRYYRFCYGDFQPDNSYSVNPDTDIPGCVEVQVENGWMPITSYTLLRKQDGMPETLPNGTVINTTVLRVPKELVHPPDPGMTQANTERTPRAIRVTGKFHIERGETITTPYEILRYLFERYSNTPWSDLYFNIPEIQAELAPLKDAPVGIFIDRPTKLFEVIAKLQDGSIMGWQFTSYGGVFTARLHNPGRKAERRIKQHHIVNLYGLEIDMNGSNYVSNAYVRYAKNYSEDDLWNEYRDENIRQDILSLRGADVMGGVETLLKNEEDAVKRFENFTNTSKKITPRISGIKLSGQKWFGFREYDVVEIDFGDLTGIREWYILSSETDVQTEMVTVKVMAKL